MTTLTPRQILEQVKERIMAEPGKYNQMSFCGMQCCIGGHIDAIVNGTDVHNSRPYNTRETLNLVPLIAAEAIGDTEDNWLLGSIKKSDEYGDDDWDSTDGFWPPDLSDEYMAYHSPAARARVGCKAIDRYIEERGL